MHVYAVSNTESWAHNGSKDIQNGKVVTAILHSICDICDPQKCLW